MVAALAAGLTSLGCDDPWHSCTDIGCTSGVSIAVAPKGSSFVDGDYELELTLDERKVTCNFGVSDDARALVACGNGVRLSVSREEISISIEGAPQAVTTRLSLEGAPLVNDRRMPEYKRIQPNEGCEPICDNATVELSAS
jgi:hypothetical protein